MQMKLKNIPWDKILFLLRLHNGSVYVKIFFDSNRKRRENKCN